MSPIDATTSTGSRRFLALFAAVTMMLSLLAIGAVPAYGDPPPEGPDEITVDGDTFGVTQKSGPVSHFETSHSNPTTAFTSRNVWEGHGSEHLPCENGIHWVDNTELLTISNCLEGEAEDVTDVVEEEPDLAEVLVSGACVNEEFVIRVSSANASVDVDLNANGSFQPNEIDVDDGAHTITASGEIRWEATADADAEFAAGAATSGAIEILDCEDEEVGAIVTELAEVSVTGTCVENEFVVTVISANASVNVDLNADGSFEAGEIGVASGNHVISAAGEIDWEATAHDDAEFAAGAATSGTIDILDCDEEETQVVADLELLVDKSATQNGVELGASTAAASNEAIIFAVTITNDSSEDVEITSLEDDVFGELNGDVDCEIGTELASGSSCSFTFEKTLNTDLTSDQLELMIETESHSDVVTVVGEGVETSEEVAADAELTFPVIPTEVLGIVIVAPDEEAPALGPVTPVKTGPADVSDEVLAVEVEAEELPFTGFESGRLIGLAIMLLGGGVLALKLRPRQNES